MGYEEFARERQKLKEGKDIVRSNKDICDISIDLLKNEYENGVQMGVSTGIHQLDDTLKYLRGTQNCYTGYPNEGKCLAKGTLVIMYDGSKKKVEDLKPGDLLMGMDNTPRKILSTCKGSERMYEIQQNTSDNYIVNKSHILTLKRWNSRKSKYEIKDIPLKKFISYTKETQKKHKGFKSRIEYPEQKNNIHPYLLGVWLGDGDKREPLIYLGEKKKEVVSEIFEINEQNKYGEISISNGNKKRTCKKYYFKKVLKNNLKELNLISNKHIPNSYKIDSIKNRLLLLAGISDTDGYYTGNTLEIVQKRKKLIFDIKEVADSLGYKTNIVEKIVKGVIYYRLNIMGKLSDIPTKRLKMKDARNLLTGIKVNPLGEGEYYGFVIDGDHRFLLGDYTVTHNTTFTLYLMVVKSLFDNWKWCFWSPEMKSATFYNGKVQVHYNDLINEIIEIITGKTVYKQISEKYKIERVGLNEYIKHAEWVKKHFICLDPKNNHIDHIYDLLLRTYEKEGFDGVLIDPFKNVRMDEGGREDQKLDALFSRFKNLAVETNCVMNWIAHPRSKVERLKDDQKMPCDQYMLSGGAAWDNNMDGIYSVLRPNSHIEPNDTSVHFYNLKQRKQKFTTKKGMYPFINYNQKIQRYIFNGNDPLDKQNTEFKPLTEFNLF